MWRLNCGCGQVPEPIEFDIIGTPSVYTDSNVVLPNKMDNTCCLIEKIILEYFDIINKLECGILPDLENLLQEISLIYMNNEQPTVLFKQK